MIRFSMALSSVLLGSLLISPVTTGQEPPKPASPAGEPIGQAEAAVATPAQLRSTNVIEPLSTIEYPHTGQEMWVRTKLYDELELKFGLSLSDADEALRSQLEVPPGQGVVVVGVNPGGLAEQAGLKVNDVLLSLGDQPAKSWGQVKQILLALGKDAIEVKLIREGKPSRMSLVGPKHGFPPEAAEFWVGTPVSPVDATLRAHLSTLSADSGLIVNDVVKGSPAEQASVQKNDILITMDGKPLKNADALIAQIQASQGKPVPLQILRAGKPLTLTITPAKRAHPTVINLRKNPGSQFSYQVVRPNMAIEVAPRPPQPLDMDSISAQERPVESKRSASGNYTLIAPYTGVVHNPYFETNPAAPISAYTAPTLTPTIPTWAYYNNTVPDLSAARIEAQLKEVVTKLDEITKALEALKRSAGK